MLMTSALVQVYNTFYLSRWNSQIDSVSIFSFFFFFFFFYIFFFNFILFLNLT